MGIEIERKFLVKNTDFVQEAFKSDRIIQGYLSSVPERTVRIRIRNNDAFITIKGKTNDSGVSRFEWEKPIVVNEAENLIKLCEEGVIDKTRYLVANDGKTFEVDIFNGDNKGLIIAEIELSDENESFPRPEWLGEEVTGDIRYYNSYLSKHPFSKWQ